MERADFELRPIGVVESVGLHEAEIVEIDGTPIIDIKPVLRSLSNR